MRVQRQALETAPLVTVDEDADPQAYAGHFVRVRPSAAATDAQLAKLKRDLLKAGALAVRTMPRPPADALQLSPTAELVGQMVDEAEGELPGVRMLVRELVQASSSQHKDELIELLEHLADEEGL